MPIHNADIAALFDEVADLLEINGENPFRVRAYRNAARTMEELGTEVSTLMAQDVELTRLPGIGEDLAHKIMAIVETGRCEILEELRRGLPPGITELLKLPGLGPKRIKLLMDHLHITCLDDLRRAARRGRYRNSAVSARKPSSKSSLPAAHRPRKDSASSLRWRASTRMH